MSTAAPSIFGWMVSGHDVERWVLETLQKWSGTWLSEAERQHGYTAGHFQRVRAWVLGPTFDKWPEDQVPAIIVQSPGIASAPVRDGDGKYRATWLMQVSAVCVADTQDHSHEQAHLYLLAHRELLLNRASLEGRAAGTKWLADDYTDVPYDDIRTIGAAQATFSIEVHDVGNTGRGPRHPDDVPLSPDTDPWPDWPTADLVEVEVDKKEEA